MKRVRLRSVSKKRLESGALIPGSTFARPGLRAHSSPDVPRPPLVRTSPPKKKPRSKSETGGTTQREHPARNPLRRDKPVRRRNPSRRKSEFARCYGSKARVAWVKSLPCAVASASVTFHDPEIENAHVTTGGMGRKGDANQIVPLCRGHHRLLHSWGVVSFQRVFKLDLRVLADLTESRWQQLKGAA